ncbi:amidohydrolase [Chachezhania sediminis]|uniref:amidohydrolase n=1 Tax=Chachezhania sediminis TaxID=2599291 RepID=UPI00131C8A54|nr:amidohydrolase [Chachezhania sediminis]
MQRLIGSIAVLLGAAAVLPAHAQEMADTIYSGGPILTVNDAQPRAEAVAVKDGLILAVGTLEEMEALKGQGTVVFDLNGRTMIPGFVDSHGHVVMGGLQALSANLLAPPDGTVHSIPALQDTLRDWMAANAATVKAVNLAVGFGYDQSQLEEGRVPTRADLDAVSTEVPIVIVHQSGHFGVLNSAALKVVGITAETEAPAGGVIVKGEDGEPNGVLEENAFFLSLGKLLGGLNPEAYKTFVSAGSQLWARFGYTTAQEGRATPGVVNILKQVAAEGGLPVDVVAYPDVLVDRQQILDEVSPDYVGRFRVGGAKLTIDGSPQGFTALRDRPYYDPVGDYPPAYKGYAAADMDQVRDAVSWAFENGIQILTHSNGEGASDMFLGAIAEAETKFGTAADTRPVLIHGQFLREDQVDTMKALGVFPSLFPMHTFYWGDWHRDHTVGPVNADNISPTGWVRERDMIFGTHHDAPVAFPDSMRVLSATVTRRSRSGDILGPDQRVDVPTALKAMTIWPAWQHHEEDRKGSIEPGKVADFVVLSDDPTAIDPETLADVDVLATIKGNEIVFMADPTDTTDPGLPFQRLSPEMGEKILHMMEGDHNDH